MTPRVKIETPYIQTYTDRHGRRRYYYRRKGFARAALPGLPGSPEFRASYAAAEKGITLEPRKPIQAGTFGALCLEYYGSNNFRRLAESTRRENGYVLRKLEAHLRGHPVAALERVDILRWLDEMTHGAANKMLGVLKVLMTFAQDRGYRKDNPAKGIKLLKGGEHRAWELEEMQAFEARWPLGTLERTGYALALYTGQRRGDVVRLTYKSIAGDAFRLTQGKTKTVLEIPIHPELQKAIAAVRPRCEAAILAKKGKALNPIYLGHMMAKAIEAAGLPRECVLHGLRKSAAVALIDAGCTAYQAAAITGHMTPRMLELYAKGRDQVKLGKAAMLIWAGTNREGV